MRRWGLAFVVAVGAIVSACNAAETPPSISPPPEPPRKQWAGALSPYLLKDLREFAARSGVDGRLGFAVYSVKHRRFEAEWNDTGYLVPASVLKLVVTAAALDTFPVNAYPSTTLEVSGRVRGRTLRGTLRAIGGGDPNISDRFYPDAIIPLLDWADSLKALGVDTVRGRVLAVDTFFTGPRRPAAWAARHFNTWYGAEVSALSFNDNAYEVVVEPGANAGDPPRVRIVPEVGHVAVINNARTVAGAGNGVSVTQRADEPTVIVTGSVGARGGARRWLLPVRNPPGFFRRGLLAALRERGIVVIEENAAAGPVLRSWSLVTAPMVSMVDEINQRSQNLHAELLLRHLGKYTLGDGSSRGGVAAEKRFLAKMGLDSAAFDLRDASGLSHLNRVRTRELALLLGRMARHRYASDYIGSLAQPGLDGATGKRLRDYAEAGLVRYKTGSLSGVAGLSGYVFAADGDTLAAVFLLNGYSVAAIQASALLDSLLMRTALFYNKERPALAEAHRLLSRPDAPAGFTARLRHFSREMRGTPYFLGPTGESRHGDADPLPLLDFSRVDCVTYMEAVLALSLSKRPSDLLPSLLPIRYHGDTIRYDARKHYFVAEWILGSPERFKPLALPGDTIIRKTLARSALLAAKGLQGSDLDAEIRYLPYEKALALASNWKLGNGFWGVSFLTDRPGLDGTHTGFVDVNGGKPVLRHASQLRKEVTEQDFREYLESRKGKCSGILLFEFVPPSAGG
jgi:D-alanyl-D-alanine carboxypeptidase/D-alanyl-D-alanine-endopeptidase (penicillin-binding protein 4)